MLDKLFLGVLLILLAGKWSHGKDYTPANFTEYMKLSVEVDQDNSRLGSRGSLGRPSVTWECERVTRVPSQVRSGYRLSIFYQKYLHAFGIPILSSNRVQDDALKRACYVVVFLFADRQDIRSWFYKRYGRAGVIAYSEGVTSIPEHSWLGSWWNQRARGLGATLRHPISTGGEENLLCDRGRDRYSREDIFLHEFIHGLHNLGIASNGAIPNFDGRLRQRYDYLRRTGARWRNTYAMSTDREYLAEGAQSYFDCNDEQIPTNGIHNHVNTRTELAGYDPVLYGFLLEIFPCRNQYVKRCDWRRGKRQVQFKMNCDRSGRGTLMDFHTKRPVNPPTASPPETPRPPPPNTPPAPNTPLPPKTSPHPNTPPPPSTPPPPKPQTPRPPVNCKDLHYNCPSWARRGECTRNPGYMLKKCMKSCNKCSGGGGGNCVDKNRNCRWWAQYGECQKNPGFMLVSCKKSCRQC